MSRHPLFLLGLALASTPALAEEPAPAPPKGPELACRVFPINLSDGQGGYFETSDRTGPIGAWLGPMEDAGWVLDHLDYEVYQKSTGFPEPTVMVCMRRTP